MVQNCIGIAYLLKVILKIIIFSVKMVGKARPLTLLEDRMLLHYIGETYIYLHILLIGEGVGAL
uniref:Uncharacterized protein n=1 Tax=Lepeophtheirus salmonis TaxID=72036 RepID=A0A0K2TFM0_LEPSM